MPKNTYKVEINGQDSASTVYTPTDTNIPRPSQEQLQASSLEIEDAGFWLRAAAHLVETILAGPIIILCQDYFIGIAAIAILYCGPEMIFKAGIGKLVFGLRIVHVSGEKPSALRVFLRRCFYLLSSLPLGIGFFMAGLTREKRSLHDFICKTRVVLIRKRPSGGMLALIIFGLFGLYVAVSVAGQPFVHPIVMKAMKETLEMNALKGIFSTQ